MSPKYDPNLEKYLKEYQENPRSKVFAPLAETYRKSGLIDEAIDICREGLEYHPNFTSGLVALARCYFDKALYTAAIKELEKVVSEVPDNYLAQKVLAQSYSMIGDKNNSLKAYKTLLFLNPRDEEIKKIIAEMEGTAEKVPNSFLPDEHHEKEDIYIPPIPRFEPPQFEHIEAEDDEELKFQEKPAGMAFKQSNEPKTNKEERILTELSTMTMGELLESQGLTTKAVEVYRKLLELEPDNIILKAKLERLEAQLGVTEMTEKEIVEHENSRPEEVFSDHPDSDKIAEEDLMDAELIYKPESKEELYEEHTLPPIPDDILDDKWLLGPTTEMPVPGPKSETEDNKLKKLYTLLEGITKYKSSHSR